MIHNIIYVTTHNIRKNDNYFFIFLLRNIVVIIPIENKNDVLFRVIRMIIYVSDLRLNKYKIYSQIFVLYLIKLMVTDIYL